MARKTFSEIYKSYRAGTTSKEDTSVSFQKTKSYSDIYSEYKAKKLIGFDTLETDLQSVTNSINSVYSGWQDADTMKNTKNSVSAMYDRLNNYKAYANNNAKSDMTEFNAGIDSLISGYKTALDNWENQSAVYSQYVSADAYNTAKKNYDLSKKYAGLSYKGVKKAIEESEDDDFLSQYGLNVGYSDLKDYNAELRDLAERIKNSAGIEKTSLQEYYDKLEAKRNQYELDNKFDLYKGMMNNADFAEKSIYVPSEKGFINSLTSTYDYIGASSAGRLDMLKNNLFGIPNVEYLTDDEKSVYFYLYNTEGEKSADAYLYNIKVVLDRRKEAKKQEDTERLLEKTGVIGQTIGSALAVPWSVVGDVAAFVQDSLYSIAGMKANPYDYGHTLSNQADYIKNYTSDSIAKATKGAELFGENVPSFLYDTLLSIGESATRLAVTSGIGSGTKATEVISSVWAGAGAASDRVKELKEAGATDEQVLKGSLAAGTMEVLGEKFSIGNLLSPKISDTVLSVVKEVAKQMGVEGMEEMVTEVGNTLSDTLVRGNTSDMAMMLEEYMAQGYTKAEAEKHVLNNVKKNVVMAGIGGALSGGIMGSVASGSQYGTYKGIGQNIIDNNQTKILSEMAKEAVPGSKYIKMLEDGKAKSGQVGNLYTQTAEGLKKQARTKVNSSVEGTIASRLISMGENTDSARKISAAVLKSLNNESLSKAERTLLKTKNAQTVEKEMQTGAKWFSNSNLSKSASREAKIKRIQSEKLSSVFTPESEENVRIRKRVAEMNVGEKNTDMASGKQIVIEGIEHDDLNNVILKTNAGEKRLDEVTLTNEMAEIVSRAEIMDETKAAAYITSYKGGDVEKYSTSFDLAFSYGQKGFGNENVLRNKGTLTDEQALKAYSAGVKSGSATTQKNIEEIAEKYSEQNKAIVPGKFDDSAVDYEKINKRQAGMVQFVKMLSKATGVNVSFFQSEADEAGRRTAENGRYDRNTNTIYVDVYAGVTDTILEDSIAPTLSHEITHWMKEKAPEAYNKISGVVMDVLAQEFGVTPGEVVNAEVNRYKNEYGEEISEDYAQDELIARACEDMLTNSNKVKEYVSGMDEETVKTVRDKLKDVIEKFKEWIADLLSVYKSSSEEARILRKYSAKVDELQKVWDDAFDKAIKANQALNVNKSVEMPMADSDRMYSKRDIDRNRLLTASEFATFYNMLSDKKNGTKFPRDREGNYIFTIGNKLVYNDGKYNNPKIVKVVIFDVKNDYGNTYASFAQEEVIDYETNRKYEGVSFEEFTRFVQSFIRKDFDREVSVRTNYGQNHGRNVKNGLGNKTQVRNKLRINFEDEQDGSGSITEGRGSESESVRFFNRDSEGNGLTKEQSELNKRDSVALDTDDKSVKVKITEPLAENISQDEATVKRLKKESKEDGFTDNEDIRYSKRNTESIYDAVGELKRLQKENEKLKKDVERLRERNRLERTVTKGTVLNESHIATVAGHLLKTADSTYNKDNLVKELKDIYRYLQTEEVSWDLLMLKATDTARRIISEAKQRKVVNDYSKEILNTMRGSRIYLSDVQKEEAKYTGGKDWYKYYFGRLQIANDGIPLDVLWQEWAELYPDVFETDISDAEMATTVLDVYDAVRASSEIVEAYDHEEAARELALEIYNQFWNVSPVRTLADRHEKEIKQLKYEHRMEMKELKEEYTKRQTEKVYRTKEHYKETIKKLRDKKIAEIKMLKRSIEQNRIYRDKQDKRAEIDKIIKKALKLNTWLVKNSKEHHIPEILKKPVAAVLKSLNFSSERLLGMWGGKTKGQPTQKDISFSKAFENLADVLGTVNDAQINDKEVDGLYGHLDLPSDFIEFVDNTRKDINDLLREVGDNEYILNKMSIEQLKNVDRILTILNHTIVQTNKALAASHESGIANLAQDTMIYAEKQGNHSERVGSLTNFFNYQNVLPYYMFKRLGSGATHIFESLQDGWDKFAFNVKEIKDYAEKTYTAKEVHKWSEEIHEIKVLSGTEVKMTTAQIMSLYCLAKREQALGHLVGGGIRVSDIKKGNRTISQPDGATLQTKDIQAIISTLSERQREVADKLQKFMNTTCTEWGNAISMVRFGYNAFGEPNYFPIVSDKNNLAQDDATEKNNSLFRLLNMSFTKGLTEKANNRVEIQNIFDVFANHTSDMAKYNALALSVLDTFKWYNYKEKWKENRSDRRATQFKTMGVKQSLEKAYGKGAGNYIVQFMKDINGAATGGITTGEQFAKKMISNYKVAAVGANLRVALLQPTAYVRASVIMDPKYLIKGLAKKPQTEKARKNCGIALWKSLGFFDTNITKGVTDQIKHEDTAMDKIKEGSMKLAELGDSWTWGYLYNACEAEVSEKQPGLIGREKDEAVSKRLRELIYATQVVDSTMTRTHMMRNKSTLNQMLTSFMSESSVSYNMLHDCYMQWNIDKRQIGKSRALKKNGKKIARTFITYALTAFSAAAVGALPDTLRDDEENTLVLYLENILENAKTDILGMIPYIKDIFSVIQGYSPSRMDEQYMVSVWSAYKKILKSIENGEFNYNTVHAIVKAISQVGGVPLSNAMREAVTIWNNTIGDVYPSLRLK